MFRGQYYHTMDGKGRVSLPAKFREVLAKSYPSWESDQTLILTRTFNRCLILYPMEKWCSFEEAISKLPQSDPHVQRLKRVYIAGAEDVKLDSHGRLLVPQTLRDFANLERGDVVWAGQLENIELWSKEKWQKTLEQDLENPEELYEAVGRLGL